MHRKAQFKSKHNKDNNYKNLSCPNCSYNIIIKRGFRKTQNRGKIQRYSCKDCNKRFVEDSGFYRMRNSAQKITLCLDLFFRGISTRKIQEHLQAFYPHNSSHMSIYRWIVKYAKIISKFTDRLKLKVGEEIQIDEIEYKTKGKQSWFIDCLDTKTRFIVHSKYIKAREKEELKAILLEIKDKTKNQVKKVTTDGLTAYQNIVKKAFGYNLKLGKYNVEHNIVNASKGEGFVNKIERLHNSVRHRTKTFRGFKNLESARAIMKGYEIYYNFIRKHQAINCCPYELTVPELKLKDPNRWLELIKLSKV